jgi:MFS family permease
MPDPAARPEPEVTASAVPLWRRRDIQALLFALFVAGAGQTFSFAVLPALGRELGLDAVDVSLIIILAALVFMVGGPVWGRISDRFGRRRVILFGGAWYGITTALFAVCAIAGLAGWIDPGTTLVLLIAGRMLYALLSGGMFPAAFAYIADNTAREARSRGMALGSAAFGLGAVIGPALAAALAPLGLVAPFFLFAALAGLATAICGAWVKAPERDMRGALPGFRLNRRFLPLMLAGVLLFSTLGSLQQATGFYIQDLLQVTPADSVSLTGFIITAASGAAVLIQIGIVQRLRWPPKRLLLTGALITAAGAALFVAAESYWLMLLAGAVMGAGLGLIDPGFTAGMSLLVGPGRQGAIAGLGGMTRGMAFLVGPALGGLTFEAFGPRAPYAVSIAALLLAFALLWRTPVARPEDPVT